MAQFNVDIEPAPEVEPIAPEVLEALKLRYMEIKNKVDCGEEMTMQEQREVIEFFRATRVEKFVLKATTAKTPRERKAKKLSRAALIELADKKVANVELTEEEAKNYTHTLAMYAGKKLTNKEFAKLVIKDAKQEPPLNEVEKIDLDYNTEVRAF